MTTDTEGCATTQPATAASNRALASRQVAQAPDPDWWRQAVVYEIYPRSFADSTGSGIGDLGGVLSHVDHLDALGVDAVWFTPLYPSALVDGGYDVDDHRAVDPRMGTLAEFTGLVDALHVRGIKVLVDIVPNHSSDRHAWFRAALDAGPRSPERDRYIFRDGAGPSGELPPSDWQSILGGSAWTRVTAVDGTPEQWYLHLFAPEQPDWNWNDPEVREDFLTTLRFWADLGVDGFRVDTASLLAKDMSEPLPPWDLVAAGNNLLGSGGKSPFADGQHPYQDRDELDEIYGGWRRVFDAYDPPLFAVAEAWVTPGRRRRYAGSEGLGQVFDFDLLVAPWAAAAYRTTIERSLSAARSSGATTTWVMSNHDVVRHPTRLAADGAPSAMSAVPDPAVMGEQQIATGAARAAAATMLLLALPGSAYLYQGEELGLPEVLGIPEGLADDPAAVYLDGVAVRSRDGCRVPLPWTRSGTSFGFGTEGCWLPQPEWFGRYSVETQNCDDTSSLALYRAALRLRHRLQTRAELQWLDLGPDTVAFRRPNGWTSVTNFSDRPIVLPPGQVVLRSDAGTTLLAADATAWLMIPRPTDPHDQLTPTTEET